jgi:hypothetical protein
MSLSDLASLGSFVSGIAVLASLVFLFFQMRQMTEQVKQSEKNQQAAIRQGRSTRTVDITLKSSEPWFAELANKIAFDPEAVTGDDVQQFSNFWRACFYNWEDAFYQHLEGLFSELAFKTITVNVKGIMRLVPHRAQWRLWRPFYGPEFVSWMDSLIAQTPAQEPLDRVTAWRDAMAAARSGAPYLSFDKGDSDRVVSPVVS